MNSNRRKILEMLAEKKITLDEAERLLSLIQTEAESDRSEAKETPERKISPKYLRIEIKPNPGNLNPIPDNVNIRVPLTLIRAGMKLGAIIPPGAYNQVNSTLREKGLDFDLRNFKPENLEDILAALNDLEVDIQNGQQKVHIYAE